MHSQVVFIEFCNSMLFTRQYPVERSVFQSKLNTVIFVSRFNTLVSTHIYRQDSFFCAASRFHALSRYVDDINALVFLLTTTGVVWYRITFPCKHGTKWVDRRWGRINDESSCPDYSLSCAFVGPAWTSFDYVCFSVLNVTWLLPKGKQNVSNIHPIDTNAHWSDTLIWWKGKANDQSNACMFVNVYV